MSKLTKVFNEAMTYPGNIYILAVSLGTVSIVFTLISSINTIQDKTRKVNVETIIAVFLLGISMFLRIPYLFSKTLSVFVLTIWGVGLLIAGSIYLYSYLNNYKNNKK
jgi:hypothetical protein